MFGVSLPLRMFPAYFTILSIKRMDTHNIVLQVDQHKIHVFSLESKILQSEKLVFRSRLVVHKLEPLAVCATGSWLIKNSDITSGLLSYMLIRGNNINRLKVVATNKSLKSIVLLVFGIRC